MFTVLRPAVLVLAVGLSLSVVACAGSAADDSVESGETQDELRATSLTGDYAAGVGTGKPFDFEKLSLKHDHSFVATQPCGTDAPPGGFQCQSIKQLQGTWTTTRLSQGEMKIAFKSSIDGSTQTFFYSISGASLRLSASLHGKFSLFLKDGSAFPKAKVGEACSDNLGNIIAACPDNFACMSDGSTNPIQRCFADF
jgi:hypothetical protein